MKSADIERIVREDQQRMFRETTEQERAQGFAAQMFAIGDVPDALLLSWRTQACQYPKRLPDGLYHWRGNTALDPDVEYHEALVPVGTPGSELWPDCVAVYEDGKVVGILNHYNATNEWEIEGNINIWIRPDMQRRGIGTRLIDYAVEHFGPIKWDQQTYSVSGRKFINRYREARTQ